MFTNSTSSIQNYLRYGTLLWLLAVTSCSVTEPIRRATLRSWLGYHVHQLLATADRPAEIFSDGLTGRALVYDNVLSSAPASLSEIPEDSVAVYDRLIWDEAIAERVPPTFFEQSYDILYVDKDGYVYSFQSNASEGQIRNSFERNLVIGGVVAAVAGVVLAAILISTEPDYDY